MRPLLRAAPLFCGAVPLLLEPGGAPLLVAATLFCWKCPSSGGTAPLLRVRTPLLLERPSSTRRAQFLLKVISYVCCGHCSTAGDAPLPPGPLGRPTSAGGAPGPTSAGRAQLLLRVPLLYWVPLFFRHPSPGRARPFLLWRPFLLRRPSARGARLLLGARPYCWTSPTFA